MIKLDLLPGADFQSGPPGKTITCKLAVNDDQILNGDEMKNELENDEKVLDGCLKTPFQRASTFDRQTSGQARYESEDEHWS